MTSKRILLWTAAFSLLIPLAGGKSEKIQNLEVKAGDSVSLQTGLTGLNGKHILWIYGTSQTLLHCDEGEIQNIPDEYKGRLHLNQSTGCLTISNMRKSAVYRGEMLKGNKKHTFHYNVTVLEAGPSFNSAADPMSLRGLILAAAAACFVLFNN